MPRVAKSEERNAHRRAWRATPEGRAKSKEWQRKVYETDRGREVKREGHRRWKASEKGKKCERDSARARYMSERRVPLLTVEERKALTKASWLKTISRPGYKEKAALTKRRYHLKRTYGISLEEYERLAIDGCHICGAREAGKKSLHVDHCHSTGQVRGILCDACNKGIGSFRDDTELLEKAISYLRRG